MAGKNSTNTPHREAGKSSRNVLSPDELPVSQKRQCIDRANPLLIDSAEVSETIMHRVNDAIKESLNSQNVDMTGEPGDVIARVVTPLMTAITSAITTSVCDVLHKVLTELTRRDEERQTAASNVAQSTVTPQLRVLTYKYDALEQYTRRENVRISGITESSDSNASLEKKVVKLLQDTGTKVTEHDIAACHYTGGARNGSRPVIVRFVSRRTRTLIMKSKKNIKEKNPRVFINDDLTSLRSKLFSYVKHLDIVDNAWTIEGRIYCRKKLPVGMNHSSSRPVVIESPDDLFEKLGETSIDYHKLGLSHLA